MTKSHLLSIIFLFISISSCKAQQDSLMFNWQNPNTIPVTFNVYEVKAPPNNDIIIQQLNPIPIPHCTDSCSWITPYTFDGKTHYFRMTAVAYDTLTSTMSNTASIFTPKPVIPPKNLHVIIH